MIPKLINVAVSKIVNIEIHKFTFNVKINVPKNN